jgi:hypothetical protein
MPAGDRSRTWFPEMATELRASWRSELTWDAVIDLRNQLQRQLERILRSRSIVPARVRCSHCGHVGPGAAPVLSVRAVLFALGRFNIESKDVVRERDKAWTKHRALQQLDARGERIDPQAPAPHPHFHNPEAT